MIGRAESTGTWIEEYRKPVRNVDMFMDTKTVTGVQCRRGVRRRERRSGVRVRSVVERVVKTQVVTSRSLLT